jgi:hypothetical protein
MLLDIVHEPSSSATLCGAESELVQVITSPTFAVTGAHWKPPTAVSTVVVPVESAQTAEVPVVAAGAWLPGGGASVPAACVAGACVPAGAWLAPPEHAASAAAVASVTMPRAMERM